MGLDGAEGGVSSVQAMSFLKQRYTAKAVHGQEAKRIANAALRSQCEFTKLSKQFYYQLETIIEKYEAYLCCKTACQSIGKMVFFSYTVEEWILFDCFVGYNLGRTSCSVFV